MIYKYEDVDLIKVEMEITTYCNARCRYCPRTDKITGGPQSWLVQEHMSLETFKLIFDPQTEKIRQLKFCGQFGDPMMNPSVGKILDHALRYDKMNILINTNGGLRNVEWYKTFAQRYGQRLQIHFGIDGLDHDTNWKYREGVIFDKAYNNMLSFHQNGGDTTWQFILFSWNEHQLEEVRARGLSLGLNQTFLVDGEYRQHLEQTNPAKIDEFRLRFANIGVHDYQGI